MTPTEWNSLTVALVALVAAIGTVVVNVIAARSVARKVDVIDQKADVITGHVNSAASASNAKIEGLQKELQLLRDVMADNKETAALLAAAAPQSIAAAIKKAKS